jgi:hypothetical protein
VPLARAIEDDVLLVHTWEGQPLPREHGGPVRMITPKLYAWKGAKYRGKQVPPGKKSLFFCQSRAMTETVAENMRGAGTEVFVHHSAMSKEER